MAQSPRNIAGWAILVLLLGIATGIFKLGGAYALSLASLFRNGNSRFGNKSPEEQIRMLQAEASGSADRGSSAGAFNPAGSIYMEARANAYAIKVYSGEDPVKILTDPALFDQRLEQVFRMNVHPPEILYLGGVVWALDPQLIVTVTQSGRDVPDSKYWFLIAEPQRDLYVL